MFSKIYKLRFMLRVSAIIRRRKAEIAAIMVYEAGKPWDEAVGGLTLSQIHH
jgi:1-pyrroline-5-carboxylate dehydrogenase